jgi:hypothetical protein
MVMAMAMYQHLFAWIAPQPVDGSSGRARVVCADKQVEP